LPAAAFDILADMLGDRDRDLRLAAAEAFSRLNEKRAIAVLANVIHDSDAFVRHAAESALTTLT
jgi:HEAT repeat protein